MARPTSRRNIIRAGVVTGAAVGAGFVAYPFVRRAAAPTRPAVRSRYGPVRVAFVGVGGKGGTNLHNVASLGARVVALCDVDQTFLARRAEFHPDARQFADFRRMLADMHDGIDAVVVSTPDHTHAVVALEAVRRGKHVYCEKPLTHDIYEARVLADAARAHRVASQMGNQGHADDALRQQVDWVRAGAVGDVREVHAWTDRPIWPQGVERPTQELPQPPVEIDWDLWLGPAPRRPWALGPETTEPGKLEPTYHPFNWRGWWDFGTGALGDMACHLMDSAFWALNLTGPCTVEAVQQGLTRQTGPKWSVTTWNFPARPGVRRGTAGELPPVKVVWYDGGKQPPKPGDVTAEEWEINRGAGVMFVGDHGTMFAPYTRPPTLSAKAATRFEPPSQRPAYFLPKSPGHYEEWLDACLGGLAPASSFDYGGPLTETVLLGNLALRVGRKIEWDPVTMKAGNAPEADPFIRRAYRPGWTLTG